MIERKRKIDREREREHIWSTSTYAQRYWCFRWVYGLGNIATLFLSMSEYNTRTHAHTTHVWLRAETNSLTRTTAYTCMNSSEASAESTVCMYYIPLTYTTDQTAGDLNCGIMVGSDVWFCTCRTKWYSNDVEKIIGLSFLNRSICSNLLFVGQITKT